ncbi:MAG: S9 family peptidase [Fimbriimonadales bacterium]|nr:S9 family peptidase [Fimbriimonadales bacterium]
MAKRTMLPEDIVRIALPGDPQFSPDGTRVVFPVKSTGDKWKTVSRLYQWSVSGLRQLTFGQVADGPVKWKPDGSGFAFASDRHKPLSQIFFMPADGGEPRPITNLPEGTLGRFEWAPDGQRIALLFRERCCERTHVAKEGREESGESEPPVEIDSLIWRMDGDGVFGSDRYSIYVLDIESGKHHKCVSSATDGEYSFCWTRDSQSLVVSYNPSPRPTIEPWRDELFLVDVISAEQRKLEGIPPGNISALASQPTGDLVSMMFQDRSSDRFGIKSNLLATYDLDTSEFHILTGNDIDVGVHVIGDCRDAPEPRLLWTHDGTRILLSLSERGSTQVAEFDVRSNTLKRLTAVEGERIFGSVSATGELAVCCLSSTGFPEVTILEDNGTERWRSSFNSGLASEVELAKPIEHWIEPEPGVSVQVWELRHPSAEPQPIVIEVHGGPHGMYHCCVFVEMQLLAAAGYAVVFANIRGSTGYGEEFARCISGDWGDKDWKDIQAVTRFAKELPGVDPDRVAIIGGSYGGYMVNWAISHSTDYRVAVTDRCVSNLLSKSGNSDYTFVPDGVWPGAAFDRWEHLWERSPVKHFKNVKTPTLVIHSEGDLRCHIEQGEEVFTFLQLLGVPSKLVRYPQTTSHGMSRNGPADLRIHRLKQILEWFKLYL